MGEIWKDIEGYEGLYQVSNLGRIKSLKRKRIRILKLFHDKGGYIWVSLRKDNIGHRMYVHHLVAFAFISGLSKEINHKDGDKSNNNANNLEWSNRSKNMKHAYSLGLLPKGSAHKEWKGYISIYTKSIDFVIQKESVTDVVEWIQKNTNYQNICSTNIYRVINNRQHTAYGFIFRRTQEKIES
jgi:hypothetical protein